MTMQIIMLTTLGLSTMTMTMLTMVRVCQPLPPLQPTPRIRLRGTSPLVPPLTLRTRVSIFSNLQIQTGTI